MPRAFGSDRLETGPDGAPLLVCRVTKNWSGRTSATRTSAEHPGTAVRWEDELYEVLEVAVLPSGEIGYRLASWDERHTIRTLQAYGQEAEAAREAERRDMSRRVASRRISIALALLAGHLPGSVQERLENEFAVSATTLTAVSAAPLFLGGAFCTIWLLISAFAGLAGAGGGVALLPFPVLLVGAYFFIESSLRLVVALVQGRPVGSVPGTLLYEAWLRGAHRFWRSRAKPGPSEVTRS